MVKIRFSDDIKRSMERNNYKLSEQDDPWNKYFMIAGDIDEKSENDTKTREDEINEYLSLVVKGKKDIICELGVEMGAGRIIASFDELKQMVDEGYNIVSAKCLNADRDLIEVEFQKYVNDEELIERRRKFL